MTTAPQDGRRRRSSLDSADAGDLAFRAARGEAAAWEALVREYWRRVYALALSRLRSSDAAEEVAQSVFVTVAEQLGSGRYTEAAKFESWLFTIAMNRVRDEARRQRRQNAALSAQAGVSGSATPDPATLPGEPSAALREAVAALDELDQDVLRLRHQAGLSFRRIADALGAPLGTVLARHHRALAKLRDLLGDGAPTPTNTSREKA